MTYKEFKEKEIRELESSAVYHDIYVGTTPWTVKEGIKLDNKVILVAPNEMDFETYCNMKRLIIGYEEMCFAEDNRQIFTENDFKLFDKNFRRSMEDLFYRDSENPNSQIDDVIAIYKRLDWDTKATQDSIKHMLQHMYEECMESNCPYMSVSNSGFKMTIDLCNEHEVRIEFIAAEAYFMDSYSK